MSHLRPYQAALDAAIGDAWAHGARNVLATAPTGAGKTVLFCRILARHQGAAVAIAHRQELVSQISVSLAREGVRHTIIAPRSIVKFICRLHSEETGQTFYDPAATIGVAGVDTINSRSDQLRRWFEQITLWVMDEAHHVLQSNKWGKAIELAPHAWGLGVTATPCRADGKGLGRHADGLFDDLVTGPSMRDLISDGYLSDFRVFAPETADLDLSNVPIGSTGDYSHKKLVEATRRSHLVGDVVEHYQRFAPGALGVTFVPDVQTAHDIASRYRSAGVPAEAISAKTPEPVRHELMQKFRRGDLKQLVNVDILGEGVDVPAIEVVSMARPTASYPLFVQQFGRALRGLEGKERAKIIDHVGNVRRHKGPPDLGRHWTLDRRPAARKGERDPDAIPYRVCVGCTSPFPMTKKVCPWCGWVWEPASRDGPVQVEGDLVELSEAALNELRDEVTRIDQAPQTVAAQMERSGASGLVVASAAKQHRLRSEAQQSLRRLVAIFGGLHAARGCDTSETYRRFFFRYGVDVLSAQTLGRPEAEKLSLLLISDLIGGRV